MAKRWTDLSKDIRRIKRTGALKRCNHRCVGCGVRAWDCPLSLEVHHLKPVSQGGNHKKSNLVMLCTICHDEVHKDTPRRMRAIAA